MDGGRSSFTVRVGILHRHVTPKVSGSFLWYFALVGKSFDYSYIKSSDELLKYVRYEEAWEHFLRREQDGGV